MFATSATAIAVRFVELAQRSGNPVSNLKLQKLVTLVQSLSMYSTGAAAFREDVQAWDNGPAIKPLYGAYKVFGKHSIDRVVPTRHSSDPVSSDVHMMIDEVWDVAGGLTASQLWKLSHDEGPWERYYVRNTRDIVIPNDQLGAAWTDYLACATGMTTPATIERNRPVLGRGQLGYESADHGRYAAATFTPARVRTRGA
jgi:uncharacterized phage-associated protein